ncbi:MAG: putative lacX protein [Bacteroidetes bacterium]|nr:putative lacX protein [Bacteroidota bacterium]
MKETIENDRLRVEIAHAGAELSSIFHKQQQKEYLWQGSSDWWPRRAPVLFPVVGKLNDNTYRISGKVYSLPQHGFARDMVFSVEQQEKKQKIVFVLRSGESTLGNYPFEFELGITYELQGTSLSVSYEVTNPAKEVLYFSIGAHPGFNCPLNADEQFSDYYLEFEKKETLDRQLLDGGVFNGETERVMTDTNILPLEEALFKKDAIVFKNMSSESMTLKSRRSDHSLKFSFRDFPYFGIWTKPGAPFICLEPWCGIADNKSFDGDLQNKEGIVALQPEEHFIRFWSVTL